MKTIILVRHAKASRDIVGIEDFDRPLTEAGYAEAYKMAAAIKKKKIKTDLMISSPAVRAVSTAYIFARELSHPINKILIREKLFTDNYHGTLKFLKKLPKKISSVMLFGHNPSFEELANYLSETTIEKIHTCGALGLEKAKSSKLEKHSMKIIFYLHPKLNIE